MPVPPPPRIPDGDDLGVGGGVAGLNAEVVTTGHDRGGGGVH